MSSIPASGDNAYEAEMREAWRAFLQSRYRAIWILRVSRYNFDKRPESYLGCRKLINGHWCSVAVQIISEPEICHGVGIW